jgi:glycerol-3-phosphate O-acyltransferase/dihydroxyacetone phosphate acyltransferase
MYGSFTTHGTKADDENPIVEGWRDVDEVVRFLKERGAKIPSLGPEDDWAALGSEGEGYSPAAEETDSMVWETPSDDI